MRRAVMVVCAALLFVPVIMKSRPSRDIPVRAAFRALSSSSVSVKISGEVLHSGIYEVPANSLAKAAIKMADPLCSLRSLVIDSSASRPLVNGSAIKLAVQGDGTPLLTAYQMTVSERIVLNIPLDISMMSEADFDRLPGIGSALARRIVTYRQYNDGVLRVNDLSMIEGIGEKKYKVLRTYFQVP